MSTTLYDVRITRDRRSSPLNVGLWIAQVLLAVFFLLAGGMHAFMPIEQAAKIAAVKPWLTPLAAAGLATIMLLAMPVHIARSEVSMLGRNIAALIIAAFVVWGRASRVRIEAR